MTHLEAQILVLRSLAEHCATGMQNNQHNPEVLKEYEKRLSLFNFQANWRQGVADKEVREAAAATDVIVTFSPTKNKYMQNEIHGETFDEKSTNVRQNNLPGETLGASPILDKSERPVLTKGQERVRIYYQPFNKVDQEWIAGVKTKGAELIDMIDNFPRPAGFDARQTGEFERLRSLAQTYIENGIEKATKMATS